MKQQQLAFQQKEQEKQKAANIALEKQQSHEEAYKLAWEK